MTTPNEPIDPGTPEDGTTSSNEDGSPTSSGTQWFDHAEGEHTQPLPYLSSEPTPTPKPQLSRGAGIAAIVVLALLVGGAAGIGGAAWYDQWSGDSDAQTTVAASSTPGAAPAGTIEQVAAKVLPSVVQINVTGQNESGSGSGIVLNTDGMILTNNHVVVIAANGGGITVSLNNGKTYPATLIGADPVTDSAVIQVQNVSGLVPAILGHSGNLRVGQAVVAIGAPYGLSSTVTSGIVSALNRPVSVQESDNSNQFNPFGRQQSSSLSATYPAIQTDAAINPGNSGGALVDLSGQVVGMNSSIQTGNSGSTGSVGLGFAIPIDELLPIINQIINHQTPTHARLGVTVSDAANTASQQGAQIQSIDASGAAQAAGLKIGDLITEVDKTVITDGDSLVATIRGHRPGEAVTLTYLRNGQTDTVKVTLGSDAATKNS